MISADATDNQIFKQDELVNFSTDDAKNKNKTETELDKKDEETLALINKAIA